MAHPKLLLHQQPILLVHCGPARSWNPKSIVNIVTHIMSNAKSFPALPAFHLMQKYFSTESHHIPWSIVETGTKIVDMQDGMSVRPRASEKIIHHGCGSHIAMCWSDSVGNDLPGRKRRIPTLDVWMSVGQKISTSKMLHGLMSFPI